MKVLVTGAAGRMGSQVVPRLLAEHWQVVAVDTKDRGTLAVPVQGVDLRDAQAVRDLLAGGVDALVHLANMGSWIDQTPEVAINQNMAMCLNLFQSAVAAGVGKIVFASSIHASCGIRADLSSVNQTIVPYLPLDGQAPATPGNYYGLFKSMAEQMLRFYAQAHGLATFALRLPLLVNDVASARRAREANPISPLTLALGFSYLTYADSARLVVDCLKSDVQGHRTYLPASSRWLHDQPVAAIIEQHYRDIPLRRPLDQMDCLIDISQIEKDTGWRPLE